MHESLDDKKRERDKYINLVDSDIKSIKFDTTAHIKYIKFICGTVLLGFFYMWCSSNNDSNFFKTLESNSIFLHVNVFMPYIIILFLLFFVYKSAIAIRGKIDLNYYQKYAFQRKIFAEFILHKLGYSNGTIGVKEILAKFKKYDKDVEFDYYEFRDYVDRFIKTRYKFDYPELFIENFTLLILYNEEVEGTLVKLNKEDYVFIVKNNIDFILHVLK